MRVLTLRLLGAPAVAELPVSVVSEDVGVVTVTPAATPVPTGGREVTVSVTGVAAGTAAVNFRYGVDETALTVIVGPLPPGQEPFTPADSVGVEVTP